MSRAAEQVAESLLEVVDRRREYRECVERCDTSPGYFCSYSYHAMEKALDKFGEALRAFVLETVAEAPARPPQEGT